MAHRSPAMKVNFFYHSFNYFINKSRKFRQMLGILHNQTKLNREKRIRVKRDDLFSEHFSSLALSLLSSLILVLSQSLSHSFT